MLQREAGSSPWSDDRRIGDEPAWYQLGAPRWHAAVPGSSSTAETLTTVVDPLTAASRAGDTRAIAALIAATAAGVLLVRLSRLSVPLGFAALMAIATIGSVLPVAAPVSITHALLTLTAACLLLLPPEAAATFSRGRRATMAALTVFGAAVHPAFIAFAAGVWLIESWGSTPAQRLRVLVLGCAALGAGLLVAAMAMRASVSADGVTVATPDVLKLIVALVTGRFPLGLQPSSAGSLSDAVARVSPVPLLLWAAASGVGLAVSRWSRLETRSALAGVLVLLFASTTWVPDLAAAVAPATISMLVLAARGLTWVSQQPLPGARVLALAAAAGIAAAGFVTPREPLRIQNAQMQAFVESASPLAATVWSADRLATARALLQHDPDLTRRRRWIGDDMLRGTAESEGMVVFVEEGLMAGAPPAVWFAPQVLAYPSAQRFFAAQPNTTWLAMAVRGNAGGEFCRGVLDALGVDDASATHAVALARLGGAFSSMSASEQLEIAFGRRVAALDQTAPARFLVDARDGVRIVINGTTVAQAPRGLVLGLFDRWQNASRGFVMTDCADVTLPAIDDRRLRAAHVVERHDHRALPAVPGLASSPVEVPFTESGAAWFGPGWHGVEAEPMRWTSARAAHVYVVSARAQAVRVRLQATLAAPAANDLSLLWNGAPLAPAQPFSGDGEWLVPAVLVRRGLNTVTIRVDELTSPAATGRSNDTRLLGAAVSYLSFAPIRAATTPGPSTAPR